MLHGTATLSLAQDSSLSVLFATIGHVGVVAIFGAAFLIINAALYAADVALGWDFARKHIGGER